jgi:dihydrofolate reductase
MGRKTWDSLPKKPLPNRLNMIVTSQTKSSVGCDLINGEYMALNLDNVILQLQNCDDTNYFVIGGGQIYKELLPYCDRVYVTKIFKNHD